MMEFYGMDDSKFEVINPLFCNYYRRFIPNFAEYSRHLTKLSKKNEPFNWTKECESNFTYLKNALLHPRILKYP